MERRSRIEKIQNPFSKPPINRSTSINRQAGELVPGRPVRVVKNIPYVCLVNTVYHVLYTLCTVCSPRCVPESIEFLDASSICLLMCQRFLLMKKMFPCVLQFYGRVIFYDRTSIRDFSFFVNSFDFLRFSLGQKAFTFTNSLFEAAV